MLEPQNPTPATLGLKIKGVVTPAMPVASRQDLRPCDLT